MKILVTGCAGFIGFHLCNYILSNSKFSVYGIDNLNTYYDITLKKNRLKLLKKKSNKFKFYKIDITKFSVLKKNFNKNKYDYVIHLAAQAGVRYSIENPETYIKNNILGFFNIIELSRKINVKHFIYASTSSVYGSTKKYPLKESFNSDQPLSLYAATKKSNEVIAHSYSNIYEIPTTGIRFFTVYGPFGRPDMSLFKFTKSILENKKINLYNFGNHYRDFTNVEDVSKIIFKLLTKKSKSAIPYQIINVGNDNPTHLKKFVSIIEDNLGKKAIIKLLPLQMGDIFKTHANIEKLKSLIRYKPKVKIAEGIKKFILWYKDYYK